MHQLVVDVLVKPDYQIGYEQFDEDTFGHLKVHRWSSKVLKRLRADVDALIELLGRPVYALEVPEDPRQPHFLKLLGFQPCGRVMNALGQEVDIYGKSPHGQPLRRW